VRPALTTVLPAVLTVLVLAGCAGPAPDDGASIERWQARHEAAVQDDDDLLGVLSGLAGADAADGGDVERVDGGVDMEFAEPTDLRSVEFACSGRGTVRGAFAIDAGPTSRSVGVDVRCGAGPHALELPRTWRPDVERVGFHVAEASSDSAWQLLIR
jgi:hypothetical protein